MRDAVDLVLLDVNAVLGTSAVSVALADEPGAVDSLADEDMSLLDALTDPRGSAGSSGVGLWVYVPGELGAVGVWHQESEDFSGVVVRVAEAVQEVIVESGRFFGAAFPPCPAHPTHPLWAEVQDGEALWVCATDAQVTVPVGRIGGAVGG